MRCQRSRILARTPRERETPVEHQQDDGHGHELDQEERRPEQPHEYEKADVFHIRDRPGHEIAGVMAIVEGEALLLDLAVEGVSQIVGDPLGDGLTQMGLHIREGSAKDTQDHQPDRDDENGPFVQPLASNGI